MVSHVKKSLKVRKNTLDSDTRLAQGQGKRRASSHHNALRRVVTYVNLSNIVIIVNKEKESRAQAEARVAAITLDSGGLTSSLSVKASSSMTN